MGVGAATYRLSKRSAYGEENRELRHCVCVFAKVVHMQRRERTALIPARGGFLHRYIQTCTLVMTHRRAWLRLSNSQS